MSAWIFIIVFGASLLKGITGFGFALVSLPMLLFWFDAKELIPIVMLCNLVSSFCIVLQKKETQLVNRNYKVLIVLGSLFAFLGVFVLKTISEDKLLKILGIFFIAIALLSLGKVKNIGKYSTATYGIIGAIIGFLTGTVSVSGPPLALFMRKTGISNQEFREVFAWFSLITAVACMIGYFQVGLANWTTIEYTLYFFPILLVGMYLGKRLNRFLPALLFQQMCVAITIISSVFLIVQNT